MTTDQPTECTCGANRADLGLRRDDDETGILRCDTCGRPLQRAELDELTTDPHPSCCDAETEADALRADVRRLTTERDLLTAGTHALIRERDDARAALREITELGYHAGPMAAHNIARRALGDD